MKFYPISASATSLQSVRNKRSVEHTGISSDPEGIISEYCSQVEQIPESDSSERSECINTRSNNSFQNVTRKKKVKRKSRRVGELNGTK